MKARNFLLGLLATVILIPSTSQACVWIKINKYKAECRTSYREFFGAHAERRDLVMKLAFKNAQYKMAEILNDKTIVGALLDSEEIYKSGNVDTADELRLEANKILSLTNEITMTGDKYVRNTDPELGLFNWEKFDVRPSAILFGLTIPANKGFGLGKGVQKVVDRATSVIPSVKVGSASFFLAAVLVPQLAEYVAIVDNYETAPKNAELIHEDEEAGIKIYDLSTATDCTAKSDRFGFETSYPVNCQIRLSDIGFSTFPTIDARFESDEQTKAKKGPTKKRGPKWTLAFAWGQSIYRPKDVGTWGVSYSVPTAISRVPLNYPATAANPMVSGTLLGKYALARNLSWPFLRALDMAGVETAKISLNSNQNFIADLEDGIDGLKSFPPFDQFIINVRAGDFKRRKVYGAGGVNRALNVVGAGRTGSTRYSLITDQVRFGLNFGLDWIGTLGGIDADSVLSMVGAIFSKKIRSERREIKGAKDTAKDQGAALIKQIQSKQFTESLVSSFADIEISTEDGRSFSFTDLSPEEQKAVVEQAREAMEKVAEEELN